MLIILTATLSLHSTENAQQNLPEQVPISRKLLLPAAPSNGFNGVLR